MDNVFNVTRGLNEDGNRSCASEHYHIVKALQWKQVQRGAHTLLIFFPNDPKNATPLV